VWPNHEGGAYAIAFSPDGSRLATGSADKLHLFDTATGKQIHAWSGQPSRINAVSFAPSGRLLASCGGDTVVVWDLEKLTK
jgi:WD40 repeat protein